MPLTEDDIDLIDGFRGYVEDFEAADERYGPASRANSDDESVMATRFEAGPACWFEVAIHTSIPQIRVAFLSTDTSIGEELEQAVKDSGGTLSSYVGQGFAEAGLDWPDPPVEQQHEAEEYSHFSTPLDIDELGDLDFDDTRNKVVRVLEGYLLAFGPEIALDPEEEE